MRKPKARIRQNRWDNWNGYLGTRKIQEFGTDEQAAEQWLLDQEHPKQGYGDKIHPVTGEVAPEGRMWCRHHLTGTWFLEGERTPYYCSPASESYWAN